MQTEEIIAEYFSQCIIRVFLKCSTKDITIYYDEDHS